MFSFSSSSLSKQGLFSSGHPFGHKTERTEGKYKHSRLDPPVLFSEVTQKLNISPQVVPYLSGIILQLYWFLCCFSVNMSSYYLTHQSSPDPEFAEGTLCQTPPHQLPATTQAPVNKTLGHFKAKATANIGGISYLLSDF